MIQIINYCTHIIRKKELIDEYFIADDEYPKYKIKKNYIFDNKSYYYTLDKQDGKRKRYETIGYFQEEKSPFVWVETKELFQKQTFKHYHVIVKHE